MDFVIRPPVAEDHPEWLQLWRGYQRFYEADLSADEDRLWAALLDPAVEGPFALVAQATGGRLVGITHFLFHISTWSPAPRCYLNDLFTAPSARGSGVGRALIEAVDKVAREHGCSQLWWLTAHDNRTARRLYDEVAKLTPFVKYAR